VRQKGEGDGLGDGVKLIKNRRALSLMVTCEQNSIHFLLTRNLVMESDCPRVPTFCFQFGVWMTSSQSDTRAALESYCSLTLSRCFSLATIQIIRWSLL
jgi:hypothetical protein